MFARDLDRYKIIRYTYSIQDLYAVGTYIIGNLYACNYYTNDNPDGIDVLTLIKYSLGQISKLVDGLTIKQQAKLEAGTIRHSYRSRVRGRAVFPPVLDAVITFQIIVCLLKIRYSDELVSLGSTFKFLTKPGMI